MAGQRTLSANDPRSYCIHRYGHIVSHFAVDVSLPAIEAPAAPAAVSSSATDSPTGASAAMSTAASDDVLREVKQSAERAESEELVVPANRRQGKVQDTHGDPWILSRDTMRYRVKLAPQLTVKARESFWTLALEPIEGLVVEPRKAVTVAPKGFAVWRIYEADAKPPRTLLFVRALHRGRDGQLELVFCGGAEDMPGLSVPLATRWIEPLTIRIQSQAIELRGALARLSTTVITPDQVPAVLQRKQAMTAQMFTSARLGAIMPEVNRLAHLVDGEVTMHAMLKAKADEPAIASWGNPTR